MNAAAGTGPRRKRNTPQAANHTGRYSTTDSKTFLRHRGIIAIPKWLRGALARVNETISANAILREVAGMISAGIGRFL